MNKKHKISALWMMCLVLFGCLFFAACDNGDDEDTNQYTGGINLNVFGPSPVARGGILRFLGSGMDKVTGIVIPGCDELNGASIEKVSDTEIRVTVPQTAQPGYVILNTSKGEITTKTKLTYTEPISLESVSPVSVKPGDVMTLTGEYLNLIKEVIFSEGVAVSEFEAQSRKEIKVKVPIEAKSGKIIISDGGEIPNWIYSNEELAVAIPTYKSSSATTIKVGNTLTITGENLNWISSVKFNGAEVTVFTVSDDGKTLAVKVPLSVKGGDVAMICYSGVKVNAGKIETLVPSQLSVTPEVVKNGSEITISGKDLDLVAYGAFPNVADTIFLKQGSSASKIMFDVPQLAQDGDIVLNLVNGEAVKVGYETVKPTITSFSPNALMAGDEVTIIGTDLDLVAKITFAGEGDPSVEISANNYTNGNLRIQVPPTAETCAPTLTLKNGMEVKTSVALSISPSTDPTIVTMPVSANPNQVITVTGKNLNYVDAFYFGDNKVSYYENRSATSVTMQVPKEVPYGDYKLKMISYAGDTFLSKEIISIKPAKDYLWTGSAGPIGWGSEGLISFTEVALSKLKAGKTIGFDFVCDTSTTYWQIKFIGTWWTLLPSVAVTPEGDDIWDFHSTDTNFEFVLAQGDIDIILQQGLQLVGNGVIIKGIYVK